LIDKKVVVAAAIDHRIGPKQVPDYMIDMTPETEYEKLKMKKEVNFEFRERGLGRPTKLQRRQIESLKKHLDK
jgi:ribosome-associated heat shock protein Hsp15